MARQVQIRPEAGRSLPLPPQHHSPTPHFAECSMIISRAPARGFQKAANAAIAGSRGRKPMESLALELSRVGGDSTVLRSQ